MVEGLRVVGVQKPFVRFRQCLVLELQLTELVAELLVLRIQLLLRLFAALKGVLAGRKLELRLGQTLLGELQFLQRGVVDALQLFALVLHITHYAI